MSLRFLFDMLFHTSSFLSTNDKNVWRREKHELPPIEGLDSSGKCRLKSRIVKHKYTRRARKHAIPQMRKSPKKLCNWSWSDSSPVTWEPQAFLDSHLSWIFWSSPFSDSASMAVDMSEAKGESLGNALKKQTHNYNEKQLT